MPKLNRQASLQGNLHEKAVSHVIKARPEDEKELLEAKRDACKKYSISMLKNSDILKRLRDSQNREDENYARRMASLLKKRSVRTLSGIAPVAVLTKPFPCPGTCVFCPSEKGMPQSYLSNEPAVMRAIRCGFHPYVQVRSRIASLETNGHEPAKIELIIIGGTWSVLPKRYKYWFTKECLKAANDFSLTGQREPEKEDSTSSILVLRDKLIREQHRNEASAHKIVGLTIETRPDYINQEELLQMRELGCTRVELGVQSIDDDVLALNRRGHGTAEIARATKQLRDMGFKITYHIMPGLPGSTPEKDVSSFSRLWTDERYQPDQIKFYPTVVTNGSILYEWWKNGDYKPYPDKVLEKLITDCKKLIPSYVRIIRLIRDIPGESIVAGNTVTNLRQVIKDRGITCRCIRCREAKGADYDPSSADKKLISYQAGGGEEYFLSIENKKSLFGFLRLRLVKKESSRSSLEAIKGSALIRELHVYGQLAPTGKTGKVQHSGIGKELLSWAEEIAKKNGYERMAIISGIGARNYYRKLGYRLNKTYMSKKLGNHQHQLT